MPSLTYFLDRTDLSIESIQSLKFHAPGLFTNAIVKRPNITTLLKDPSIDEGSLYRVTKPIRRGKSEKMDGVMDLRPERVDGKCIYIENTDMAETRTVVQLPLMSEETSSPKKPFISKDADVNSMCDEMLSVIHKYPNLIEGRDELLDRVILYQSEYKAFKHEVDYLEGEVEDQKKQLMMFNVNYSDAVSPIKRKEKGEGDAEDSRDVDEYIAMEEEKIRILEEKLNMTE